jgi:hypothetical protein
MTLRTSGAQRLEALTSKLIADMPPVDQIRGSRFFKQESIGDIEASAITYTGRGYGRQLPDGATYTTDDWTIGKKKTVKLTTWSNAVACTRKLAKARPAEAARARAMLRPSYVKTKEAQYSLMPYYGQEGRTTPTNGGTPLVQATASDNLTYFNVAHTYEGSSQTLANIPTTAVGDITFGIAGIIKMNQLKRAQRGYDGEQYYDEQIDWVIGDDLLTQAGVIFKSEGDPISANRGLNAAKFASPMGTSAQSYVHWQKLQATQFMGRYDVGTEYPGWVEFIFEDLHPVNYNSEDKERLITGWQFTNAITGMNPRAYFNCYAPV